MESKSKRGMGEDGWEKENCEGWSKQWVRKGLSA